MHHVYILKSAIAKRHYIGVTSNIAQRLENHNRGSTRSTKPFRPWVLVYSEAFGSRGEALRREREIKSYKGGDAFRRLISKHIPGEVA